MPEMLRRLEQEKGLTYETKHRRKDGTVFPVEVSNRIIEESDRKYYQAIIRDISERKQTIERLKGINRLKEDLLSSLSFPERLKHITDGVVEIFDADFARIWLIKPGDLCASGCIHAQDTSDPHVCRYQDCCLHLMASSGRYIHIDSPMHRRVTVGCYKIGRIAAGEYNKFLTNDVTQDPIIHNHEWAKDLGLVSFVGYRLLSHENKILGVLALFSRHPISSEEDAMLEGIAGTTAQVIQIGEAEEVLRASEENYRSLFEQAVEGVFQSTPEGHYLSVNPAMARMLGYATPQEMIQGVKDIGLQIWTHPEKREEMKRLLSENGTLSNYEIEYRRPDGTSLWVSENIRLRQGANGQNFYEGFVVDITERKQAEESLLKEKVLSDTIINSLPGVFYCFDDQVRFLRWNRNFEQVTGYSGEELANLSPLDLFEGEARSLIDQAIREVFVRGEN